MNFQNEIFKGVIYHNLSKCNVCGCKNLKIEFSGCQSGEKTNEDFSECQFYLIAECENCSEIKVNPVQFQEKLIEKE